jgi:thiamine pyrophosphokinase
MKRILIFANGTLPDLESAGHIPQPDDFIIGADGGTHHALALGLVPHVVIGDFDSFDSTLLPDSSVELIRFPQDKNETDLELAIDHALKLNPEEIVIVAALGGRLDQTLANIALLADSQFATRHIKLNDGVEEIFFCRNQISVKGRSGDIVSLIPWGGEVAGVETKNLKWKLSKETLYPYKTRGISNVMLSEEASIKIDSGLLLVVHRFYSE